MNRSTVQTTKYMNGYVFFKGHVYEWDSFRNTGSHTHTNQPSNGAIKKSQVLSDFNEV